MGFGKAKYDVEEKGLDPRGNHKVLAADGRLEAVQPSEFSKIVLEAANKGIEAACDDLISKGIPLHGLDENNNIVTIYPEGQFVDLVIPDVVTEPIDVAGGTNLAELQEQKHVFSEQALEFLKKTLVPTPEEYERQKKHANEAVEGSKACEETAEVWHKVLETNELEHEKAKELYAATTAAVGDSADGLGVLVGPTTDEEDIKYVQNLLYKDLKPAKKTTKAATTIKKQATKKPTKSTK